MTEELENTLRIEQLKQQGKILSGFTHELKNHLSVINESNGLLDDYLAMGKIADKELAAKIQTICTRIQERIQTSAKMSQSLNSFSHRTDTPTSTFGINDFIKEQGVFLDRFAMLHGVKIIFNDSDSTVSINNDPSLFQFIYTRLFFTCLSCIQAQTETVMQITIEEISNGALIRFIIKGDLEQTILQKEQFLTSTGEQLALKKISAEIEYLKEGRELEILFKTLSRD